MIQNVNRRRRILTLIACGLVALLVAVMFAARPKQSVPLSAINELHESLIRDGFRLDQDLKMVDEIQVSRIRAVQAVAAVFYPDARKEQVNRSYSKDGAKLGINYGVLGENAVDVSLPADAMHCAKARKIARDLAELNPNLTISLRTNDPPTLSRTNYTRSGKIWLPTNDPTIGPKR
jgi:hypothetical protein